MLKTILNFVQPLIDKLFPKSRWGNVAYLVIGYVSANLDQLTDLVKSIFANW